MTTRQMRDGPWGTNFAPIGQLKAEKRYNLEIDTNKLLKFLERKAQQLRDNAGYSGAMSDGGASALEAQVSAYRAAQAGIYPGIWSGYIKEYQREVDPEFAEYQRLKEKFG